MKQMLFPTLLALLASCTTIAQTAPRQDGVARLGETTYVDGPLVTPLSVIEDSRCPIDVQCIWAGRVILHVRVSGHQTLDLTLGEPQQVADGALTLVSVMPDRVARVNQEIDPADYRFGFEFSGGF